MQIKPELRGDATILHLWGEFDTLYCPMLHDEIGKLVSEGTTRVALNLSQVKFINSQALGEIIKASRDLGEKDGKLVVSSPSEFCREIIRIVGLDRVVPVCETDEEAVAALG